MKTLLLKNNIEDIHLVSGEHIQIIDMIEGVSGKKTLYVEEKSDILYVCFVSHAKVDIDVRMLGSDARILFFCVSFSRDAFEVKSNISLSLESDRTFVEANLLSIAMDDARIVLDGNVSISENVSKVEGYLHEEQLLLGKNVSVSSAPMLYVKSHDVKASHGAKIHKMDQDKLFYMMSKGLSDISSQNLVLEGYLRHIFAQFDAFDEQEKEHLLQQLFQRYLTLKK